jgi:hypothetical protein
MNQLDALKMELDRHHGNFHLGLKNHTTLRCVMSKNSHNVALCKPLICLPPSFPLSLSLRDLLPAAHLPPADRHKFSRVLYSDFNIVNILGY